MVHTRQTKRKYAPQANPFMKMKDQDVQWDQPPTKKLKLTLLHKLKIAQSKLPHHPFAKRIANLTEALPQPEPKDNSCLFMIYPFADM